MVCVIASLQNDMFVGRVQTVARVNALSVQHAQPVLVEISSQSTIGRRTWGTGIHTCRMGE